MTAPAGETQGQQQGTNQAGDEKKGGDEDAAAQLKAIQEENAGLKKALEASRKVERRARRGRGAEGAEGETKESTDEGDKSDEELKRLRKETADLRRETRERDAMDALADAIEEAGGQRLNKSALKRYVKMLDSIAPDDLDDSIEDLKEDLPHLFEKSSKDEESNGRVRAPRVRRSGGDDDKPTGRGANLSKSSYNMLKANGLI